MKIGELVDTYSLDGQVTGFIERHIAEEQNLITPNAIIFVFDSLGKVWLQQRADHKKHYPGLWDTTACGGLEHGESPEQAAKRELLEETSLVCELKLVEKFLNSFPDETGKITRHRFAHLYVGLSDATPKPNDEVKGFGLFKKGALFEKINTHPEEFVPSISWELNKAFAGYDTLLK